MVVQESSKGVVILCRLVPDNHSSGRQGGPRLGQAVPPAGSRSGHKNSLRDRERLATKRGKIRRERVTKASVLGDHPEWLHCKFHKAHKKGNIAQTALIANKKQTKHSGHRPVNGKYTAQLHLKQSVNVLPSTSQDRLRKYSNLIRPSISHVVN